MSKCLTRLFCLALAMLAIPAFASTISLYEKPDDKSNVLATVKTGDQLIPVFYTDKHDWVKAANPKNGDVGWAKVSELKGPVITTSVNGTTVQQQIIADDKSPQSYSVIQYSGPKELTPEEAKAMAKKMAQQREEMEESMHNMQKHMQRMMEDMFKGFDRSFYTFPVMQPVIVVPEKVAEKAVAENKGKNAVAAKAVEKTTEKKS